MGEPDAPLTLAALRREKPQRRRGASSLGSPTLFDLSTPAPENDVLVVAVPEPVNRPLIREVPPGLPPVPPVPAEKPLLPARTPPASTVEAFGQAPSATQTEPPAEAARVWTVSGLVSHVRGHVEKGYGRVTLEGEISNWRPSASGHCYFTIKDAGAQLSAVIFRRQASLLRFQPQDGSAVKLHGQLSVYENRGQLQLIVEWMRQAGFGALLAEVQRLKEALRREGLFERKRPLPPFPRCIGVITSVQGAALRDIVKVCRRRHAAVRLLIYSAAVQGPGCPAEITAGLRWFNAHPDQAEVILVARGGGSWEDLHGFDHEQVARAIAASTLPVITGIGHATDSTIADAAADVCAPTPSAAAEILTAAQHRVEEHVMRLQARLLQTMRFQILHAQQRFARLGAAGVLRRAEDLTRRRVQHLDELHFRAESATAQALQRQLARLRTADMKLALQAPSVRLAANRSMLENTAVRLRELSRRLLTARARRLEAATLRLTALSPLRVLDRGYALLYGPTGSLLRSASEVQPGQTITARLAAGTVQAEVLATAPGGAATQTS